MANAREMLDDVDNVGIMQGFMDEMEDGMEEEEGADEENSAAKMLDRRPDSPEILMNNLRGDMRSIDARREELADLVGYAAASETPDSVLAMLQPVLAQQSGLGALPQSTPMAQGPQAPMMPPPPGPMAPSPAGAPMAPPQAMMPPPPQDGGIAALLAAGAPGGGQAPPQAPINMRDGGYVQRFQDGSDEEGVTQSEEDDSPSGMQVTPDMVALARAGYNRLLTQQIAPEVNLRKRTAEREKLYRELLGDNKEMQQAQLLLMLGQKGLQLAGNVDAQGRPLRGSTLSRFATVASEVPGAVSQFISDVDKRQNAIRMAAIQAAEKESEQTRESNLRLIESQRKAFGDILKSAKTSLGDFGKGGLGPHWNFVLRPGVAQAFADGELDTDDANRFVASANVILADGRPRTERFTNDQGYLVTRQVPGYEVPWLSQALNQGVPLYRQGPRPATKPNTVPIGAGTISPDATPAPAAEPAAEPTAAPTAAPATGPAATSGVSAAERQFAQPTIWAAAQQGIGFIPKLSSELARRLPVNIAGELGRTQQQAAETIAKLAPRVAIALRETTKLAEGERQDINMYLNLDPQYLENRVGYLNNLVSLGQVLYRIRNDALDKASDRTLSNTVANEQRMKASEIQAVINMVGIPPVVSAREEYLRLPIGAQFLVFNREKQAWVPDTRKALPDEQ